MDWFFVWFFLFVFLVKRWKSEIHVCWKKVSHWKCSEVKISKLLFSYYFFGTFCYLWETLLIVPVRNPTSQKNPVILHASWRYPFNWLCSSLLFYFLFSEKCVNSHQTFPVRWSFASERWWWWSRWWTLQWGGVCGAGDGFQSPVRVFSIREKADHQQTIVAIFPKKEPAARAGSFSPSLWVFAAKIELGIKRKSCFELDLQVKHSDWICQCKYSMYFLSNVIFCDALFHIFSLLYNQVTSQRTVSSFLCYPNVSTSQNVNFFPSLLYIHISFLFFSDCAMSFVICYSVPVLLQ